MEGPLWGGESTEDSNREVMHAAVAAVARVFRWLRLADLVRRSVCAQLAQEPRSRKAPVPGDGIRSHVQHASRLFDGQAGKKPQLDDVRFPDIEGRELVERAVEGHDIDERRVTRDDGRVQDTDSAPAPRFTVALVRTRLTSTRRIGRAAVARKWFRSRQSTLFAPARRTNASCTSAVG